MKYSWRVLVLILLPVVVAGCLTGCATNGALEIEDPTLDPAPEAEINIPSAGVISQWADSAEGSSEFASPEWGASQATGRPDVPGCGDYIAVIFDPGVGVQKIIIELPLVCGYETAWGYGHWGTNYCDDEGAEGISFTDSDYYGGKAWGWYFGSCNWIYYPPQ